MRLCFISPAFRSVHVQRWLNFFVGRGHEVHLLTLDPQEKWPGIIPHLYQPQTHWPKLGLFLKMWRARQIINRLQPDVLHALYVAGAGWIGALADYHPLVLSLLGGDVLPEQGAYDTLLKRFLTPFALHRADFIIGQSAHLLDAVKPLGTATTPQQVLPIGVDCEHFRPIGQERTIFRKSLAIPERAFVVLSPRHTQPIYNIHLIIQAMPMVLQIYPETIFVFKEHYLLDTSEYQAHCRTLIDEIGVAANVRWVGSLSYDQMPGFYGCGDLVISVAQSDGLPVSVLEAMACGLPLVVSPLSGLRECVTEGQNGLYVELGQPTELATKINFLINSETLRRQMGEANRARALAEFNFATIMGQVEKLYCALSGKG